MVTQDDKRRTTRQSKHSKTDTTETEIAIKISQKLAKSRQVHNIAEHCINFKKLITQTR